jgi:hypothetical protein
MTRVACAATLHAAAQIAPMGRRRRARRDPAGQQRQQQEESMRERVRGARWRHAAVRLGAVAVLVGGGAAVALLGGGIGSQAHAVVRPSAEISHPTQPPNDPK